MQPTLVLETDTTILEDIGTALRSIFKDVFVGMQFTVKVEGGDKPRLEARVSGAKGLPTFELLKQIGAATKAFTDERFPNKRFQILAIDGSEVSGLEITIKGGDQKYPYFHVVRKQDIATLRKGTNNERT